MELVESQGITIKKAAQILCLNYDNAKLIFRIYKEKNRTKQITYGERFSEPHKQQLKEARR